MKAFKQINFSRETRIVFSYAGLMCILGFFILLSPVLAQDDSVHTGQPRVHIDVKKQYDQQGNLSLFDSVYSWYWSGKDGLPDEYDSLFKHFHKPYFGFGYGYHPLPPLMPGYYGSDSADSLRYSWYDHFFGKDWPDEFRYPFPDFPNFPDLYDWDLQLDDSLGISFYNFGDMQKYFRDKFDFKDMMPDEEYFRQLYKQHEDFIKRYRQYQEENQKLIEKYFGNPMSEPDTLPGIKHNKFTPDPGDGKIPKKGTI